MATDAHDLVELAASLETAEAELWDDFYRAAPADIAAACGIDRERLDAAWVTVASRVDVLALNRAFGVGIARPLTDADLDRIVGIYTAAGVPRLFVVPSPAARPDALPALLERHGFTFRNRWVKLYRELDGPLPEPKSGLRIERIGAERAAEFGEIVADAFHWPVAAGPWIAATVGRPPWHHFAALDGPRIVATGAMFVHGRSAGFTFGATRPEFRGRGAQQALIARRLREAAALGCTRAVTETAEDTAERSAPSYRNMLRSGFRVAYLRPNYILTLAPAPA
jgi:GNAT superfamily N-acetyltransferase